MFVLASAACSEDITSVPVDSASTSTSTSTSDSTSSESDDPSETETDTTGEDCPAGTSGCPCEAGDQCDPGLECNAEGLCDLPSEPVCGNGEIEVGEQCDDGDQNANDAICKLDCTAQACGDGFTGPGEACDDGNLDPADQCTNICALPGCGDGVLHAGEDCDDGNLDDGDACLTTCLAASCGDAAVWVGVEACDDGNASEDDACLTGCVAASCGDGLIWTDVETCDDGNVEDLDGCNADCQETGALVWERTLDSDPGACDYYYGVDVGPDGSIAVVGTLGKTADPQSDCQIIVRRYDPDGNLLWSKTPATGPDCDEAWGVDIDADGGVWVAGHVFNPPRLHDQWIRKFDASGNTVWTRKFDGGFEDYLYGLALDGLGRAIVVGASQAAELGYDVSIRAIGPDGEIVWSKLVDQGGSDFGLDVITAGDALYVAGFLTIPGQNQDAWAAQLDLDGNTIWAHTSNGPSSGPDRAGGIARAGDGTLAIAGFQTGAVNHDIWVRRLDAGGTELWTQTWDDPQLAWADRAQELAIDGAGNLVVVGQNWTPGQQNNSFDAWMRKYDAQGNPVWTAIDNGGVDGEDVWFAVDIAPDGDIVVAGAMTTAPDACTTAVLRRYNP